MENKIPTVSNAQQQYPTEVSALKISLYFLHRTAELKIPCL